MNINLYRVIVEAHTDECAAALAKSSAWKKIGETAFETTQAGYCEDVAQRRAWGTFDYSSKVENYWDKSNPEKVHAELLKRISKGKRSRRPGPFKGSQLRGVQPTQSSRTIETVSNPVLPQMTGTGLRINRHLQIRLGDEYDEKFRRWVKENGHL